MNEPGSSIKVNDAFIPSNTIEVCPFNGHIGLTLSGEDDRLNTSCNSKRLKGN